MVQCIAESEEYRVRSNNQSLLLGGQEAAAGSEQCVIERTVGSEIRDHHPAKDDRMNEIVILNRDMPGQSG
eukprot:scaffold5682_cov52-Attheya_sp.AAC.3